MPRLPTSPPISTWNWPNLEPLRIEQSEQHPRFKAVLRALRALRIFNFIIDMVQHRYDERQALKRQCIALAKKMVIFDYLNEVQHSFDEAQESLKPHQRFAFINARQKAHEEWVKKTAHQQLRRAVETFQKGIKRIDDRYSGWISCKTMRMHLKMGRAIVCVP